MRLIELIYVILLGIVEGITEWLPISSTGHLIILEYIFGNILETNFINMFNVVIQLGAILSVFALYFKDIIPLKFKDDTYSVNDKLKLWYKIFFSCIPLIIVGIFFDDFFSDTFHNPLTVGICLIFYGIIFIFLEKFSKGKHQVDKISDITYKSVFIIGLFQILALIPGTSRSGITMIATSFLLYDRKVAVKFSFLQAIPIMMGASFLKIIKYLFNQTIGNNQIILLLIGTLTSFLVSLLVLRWFLSFVSKHTYKIFGFYRIVLGIIVISCIILGVISSF